MESGRFIMPSGSLTIVASIKARSGYKKEEPPEFPAALFLTLNFRL
jgi:hypothetical protein